MPKMTLRHGLVLFLVAALSACESVSLVELNNDFARLSEQAAVADLRLRDGEFDEMEHDTLIELNRLSFAENGDKAADAANQANSPQSKASFLNLAVRSYLNSGPVDDAKIPDLAERGIRLCQDPELKDLNALPVTCGYFHIVTAQAINNEALRTLEVLSQKALSNREPGRPPPLSAEDGKALRVVFERFLAQISEIEQAKSLIDLANADPRFKTRAIA